MDTSTVFHLAFFLTAIGWVLTIPAALLVRSRAGKPTVDGRPKMIGELASAFLSFQSAASKVLLLTAALLILNPLRPFTGELPVSDLKFTRDEKLQAEADALLHLFEKMPPVPVYLKDQPILETGTDAESGVAYTLCRGNERPSIIVKQVFYQNTNRKQLENILKHELTHAWLCRQHLMSGHDANFRAKFKEVGGFGN